MFEEAVMQLRDIQPRCEQSLEIKKITAARDSVRQRYQSTFSLHRIPQLTADDFQEFLLFRNNQHWTGLHRQGGRICQDMDELRRGLLVLHDRSQSIDVRWDSASGAIKYFGHATLSAVLHILYPQECGIWNETSEAGLRLLKIWPRFARGASEGQRYTQINHSLRELAQALAVDLWDLDSLMWGLKEYGATIALEKRVFPHVSPIKKEYLLEIYRRDSKEANWIKIKYNHQCQICGCKPFDGALEGDISEAHHICWLSRDGADSRDNMILLCPNHHAVIHTRDPAFNWKTLCFEFAPDTVIRLKINHHLKART